MTAEILSGGRGGDSLDELRKFIARKGDRIELETWTRPAWPAAPLMGDWFSLPSEQETQIPMRRHRSFRGFGKGWVELDARWDMGACGEYREIAMFGAAMNGLGFFSFANDGKRSAGRLSDATDVHADAIAFEAQMPAGLARMIYRPIDDGAPGFQFAVESRNKKGWNRFLRQIYRPA